MEYNPFLVLQTLVADDLAEVNELIINLAKTKEVSIVPTITSHITKAGGKRIRPLFTLACARMYKCNTNHHILLAAAVEFIHTATLLHDDVIDQSQKRRGIDTANNIWGNKASILVGDYLFSQAFKLMVKTESLEALWVLANASAVISEAEVWQLQLIGDFCLSQKEYIELVSAKTAVLFASACEVGAIAANSAAKSALHVYGLNFGISFQIIDDLLDYFAVEEQFGKSIGGDLAERKITLPILIAYDEATNEEKTFLQQVFTEGALQEDSLSKVKVILNKYDIYERTLQEALKYVNIGLQALEPLPNSEYKSILIDIIRYSAGRKF